MAYNAPRKKKEWWEDVIDNVGSFADKIIPGDQSSWRSPTTRNEQQVQPIVNKPTIQVTQAQPQNILNVGKTIISDDMFSLGTEKPQPIIAPVFDEKAVNERLDKGYSWEQIAKETKQDVNKVKEFSQKTRPTYGIAPKVEQPKQQFTDYEMVNGKNKEILGVDVGQYMGDYGKTYDMKVGKKVDMTQEGFLNGFDNVGKKSEQVQNAYVNKLRGLAEGGDENAKFTLKTLNDNGKLKGDWTDFFEGANETFYGGLQRSGARAVELLPGEQGTGKWADQNEENNRQASDIGKAGNVAGQVMRTGLDIGTMIVPAGAVDKLVKGTKFVQGLNNGTKLGSAAAFTARTLPGSSMFAAGDIASQASQGNDVDVAQSAALGIGVDLALPVVGKVISKIPGVDHAVKAAGKFAGDVFQAGKANVDEVAGKIRNSYDDMIDAANEKLVAKNPGTGFVPSRVARDIRKQSKAGTLTTDYTPPAPQTLKINNPSGAVIQNDGLMQPLQPYQGNGVVQTVNPDTNVKTFIKPDEEGYVAAKQAIDDARIENGGQAPLAGVKDENGNVLHITDRTPESMEGRGFTQIDTPPEIPSYVPADRVDDYLKSADYQQDQNFKRMASETKSGDPYDHPEMYDNPTPEMYDNLKAPETVQEVVAPPTPDVPATVTVTNKRKIDADANLQRLRERMANPVPQLNIATANGLKEETVQRLIRDYGVDRARSIIQRSSDATNIRNMDAFVVSQAQKNYGKVAPTGKVNINQAVPEEPLTVYRGGKPFNRDLVRSDGTSFSTDKSIADRWRGSYKDGVLEEYNLSPDTKILVAPKPDVPLGQITDADKFSLVAKAQQEGYDAVDMTALGESEIRVINPEKLNSTVAEMPTTPNTVKINQPADTTALATIDEAVTGSPIETTLYRGSGDTKKITSYNDLGIFGNDVRYYSPDANYAKKFGDNVEETAIRLENPLVIDNDVAWREIVQGAGQKYTNPVGLSPEDHAKWVDDIRKSIESKGYDGVVIRVSDDERIAKSMQNTFGESQVVPFNKTTPEVPTTATQADGSVVDTTTGEILPAEAPKTSPLADAPPVSQAVPKDTPPVVDTTPLQGPSAEPTGNLGKMTQDFFDSKKGNQSIKFRDLQELGNKVSREIDNSYKAIGSDFPTVARKVEEAHRAGVKSLDQVDLTPGEKDLWLKLQDEMDYVRRRAGLGRRKMGKGNLGEMYFPNQTTDAYQTRDSLFEGFRDKKPGNENVRKGAIDIDELSFDPEVVGGYITRYGDTKLLQEERIYQTMKRNNPDLDEEQIHKAAKKVVDLQHKVNEQKTTINKTGRKVTLVNGKKVDFAQEMHDVGVDLGKPITAINGTPRGLTNGDRLNSVMVDDGGQAVPVADYLGLNQIRDSGAYAGAHVKQAGGDRNKLADLVAERLRTKYRLPEDDMDYLVDSVRNIKEGVDDKVVLGRVDSVYRNAGKQQLMERLQMSDITNKTLKNDVSEAANQIVREGTIEKDAAAKIVQTTLRAQNALFRKLNVSSAINELSDMSSFYAIYGKDLKVANPDFSLINKYGVGEIDPALEPYLKAAVGNTKNVLQKLNEGTRLYKFVETYKAGVFLKTAEDFYTAKGISGDELTELVLRDYREFALPVDMFTKTFLDNYPLFTQYMSWGARNLQKEGKLLTGQFDAGIMKDKTTAQRIARDLYANLPAKTVFWLSTNGLKGTAIMTAFGITDFTGATQEDFSGIAEEDKSWYDKYIVPTTNMSTTLSLLNTVIQSYEKEQLKNSDKYKDADYNPYEKANFGESLVNTYTPQFIKNSLGAHDLQTRGYSDTNNSVVDQATRLFGGTVDESDSRIQYEAPEDAFNIFKSFIFGKNQTAEAREYTGRENLVDRMAEGVNPVQAVADMAREQLGPVGGKETDYNRPLTTDYSNAYKAAEEGANTALLQGGRQYNDYLDDLKKNTPELYNNYVSSMDGNHVSPEYWRSISQSENGQPDLTTFKMMSDRKKQLQKDLGTAYDPLYDLPDDQATAVLNYKATPTGTDLAVRNILNKEQWYKDLKARQAEFYAANPKESTDSDYESTERVQQWNALDDQLNSFYYDKEEVAKNGAPAWASQFPAVYQQKVINDTYGFGSDESSNFFKTNGDTYKAQKEGFDKAQLDIINQMRVIEGEPPMSWEAYQQATEIADTDGKKSGGGGSGTSITPYASGSYSHTGSSKAASVITAKAGTVKIKARGPGKKIAIKRGGKI